MLLRTLVTLLFLAPFCAAQTEDQMNTLVHDLVARLKSPDGVRQYAMPEFTWEITDKTEVNSYAHFAARKIELNKALVQAFYNAPGELAFMIAHEIGHLQDVACWERWGKEGLKGTALQRKCEASADQVGMQYLLAAGFSWYDAAGAMGRLLMSRPDVNSVTAIVFGRFTSTHPVSIDRIKQLAEYARQTCEDRPEVCER